MEDSKVVPVVEESTFKLDGSANQDMLDFVIKLKEGKPFRMVIPHQLAGEIVQRGGGRNRNKAQAHIARLSKAMTDGEWLFNGAPISFYESGYLADGNHRLTAAAASEFNLDVAVVPMLPREASATIDSSQKARNLADNLMMEGLSLPSIKSFIANNLVVFQDTGKFGNKTPTVTRATAFVKRNEPLLEECISKAEEMCAEGNPELISLNKAATWLAWANIHLYSELSEATVLLHEILTGASKEGKDSMGLILHTGISGLLNQKKKGKIFNLNNLFGTMVKTIKLQRNGETSSFKAVSYPKRSNEPFPSI